MGGKLKKTREVIFFKSVKNLKVGDLIKGIELEGSYLRISFFFGFVVKGKFFLTEEIIKLLSLQGFKKG